MVHRRPAAIRSVERHADVRRGAPIEAQNHAPDISGRRSKTEGIDVAGGLQNAVGPRVRHPRDGWLWMQVR